MKQLTCEMCGSTELVKQDGFFVCQTCGCKYSVEEAKKMMIEGTVDIQGTVNVQNAAQLENLLKLAHSSFDSKNYAQAESFCNQVISMDSLNYEAWKLKGEAINYQISAKNPRILEVYNCIMTSYRVLDEKEKGEKKEEILASIRICLEGEIDFWLEQFEAQRPTDAMLEKVKSTFLDCASKVAVSFAELGYSENDISEYINYIKSYFVTKSNQTCESAWESTVGYNYYRDDLKNLGANWGEPDTWSGLVSRDTNSYRPTANIFKTFREEGGNLIELLSFAEQHINNTTPHESITKLYENIIYYHTRLAKAKSYRIERSGDKIGWGIDQYPTNEAINARQKVIDIYKDKLKKENDKENKRRYDQTKVQNSQKDISELLKESYIHLSKKEYEEAKAIFDLIIEKSPDERVGYIGKGVSLCYDSHTTQYAEIFAPILVAYKKTANEKYKSDEKRIINYRPSTNDDTLLMQSCRYLDPSVVDALIELGADIDVKCYNRTALWLICYTTWSEKSKYKATQIARKLLNAGASVNVIADSGIALYNDNTDPEIKKVLLEKHPTLQKGPSAKPAKSSGGCYVATCVYGSYDCPQVWTLRRYRDDTLGSTWYGRLFIRTYYAISPTLVKWFGKTNWFKKLWKGKLDRMVAKLQNNGVEDTPYEDKNW